MTHRGRRIAALIITLVVLGFVLNIVAAKSRPDTQQPTGVEITPAAPPPVEPLYVPRPISLINGQLSADSSPQVVANAFASTYAGLGLGGSGADGLSTSLPRVAPDALERIVAQLTDDWKAHRTSILGGPAPQVRVTGVQPVPGRQNETVVTVSLFQQPPGAGVSGAPVERRMSVHLTNRGDGNGWMVSSVEMK